MSSWIRTLMSHSGQYLKWGLFDRDPLPQWVQGRISMLGDACHPMLPYLAQGACMAIEDAYAVAQALDAHRDDVEGGLRAYEAARKERTKQLQLLARTRAADNHLKDDASIRARNERFRQARERAATGQHAYGIEWIYEHDVTAATRSTGHAHAASS